MTPRVNLKYLFVVILTMLAKYCAVDGIHFTAGFQTEYSA